MRYDRATRLLAAVGASPRFIDDVIGDLEEIAQQRREAAEPCGTWWYAGEVLRSLPYAVWDSVRGSITAAVVDIAQKALAAQVVVVMATLLAATLAVVGYDTWSTATNADRSWLQSESFVVVLLLTVVLRYLLLGYVTVWMDARRPLLTLLAGASFDAYLHTFLVGDEIVGVVRLLLPGIAWSGIMFGGAIRLVTSASRPMSVPPEATGSRELPAT